MSVSGQSHVPAALPPEKTPCTHCTSIGGCVYRYTKHKHVQNLRIG